MASTAYTIEIEQSDIVVRVNRNNIDQDALRRFLDFLELETLRKRSQLTEEQVAELAADIDRSVWEKLDSTFGQE
jgi:RNA polymerase-interacting CarD/CdnL/TRCF family regulator